MIQSFSKELHGEISFEVQAAWRLGEVMTCSLFLKKKIITVELL